MGRAQFGESSRGEYGKVFNERWSSEIWRGPFCMRGRELFLQLLA